MHTNIIDRLFEEQLYIKLHNIFYENKTLPLIHALRI